MGRLPRLAVYIDATGAEQFMDGWIPYPRLAVLPTIAHQEILDFHIGLTAEDGIQVLSKTEKYRDIFLSKKTNSWAYGNILLGGLIGWGIDLITNCVAKPKETNYYLIEKKAMPLLAAPAAETLPTDSVGRP